MSHVHFWLQSIDRKLHDIKQAYTNRDPVAFLRSRTLFCCREVRFFSFFSNAACFSTLIYFFESSSALGAPCFGAFELEDVDLPLASFLVFFGAMAPEFTSDYPCTVTDVGTSWTTPGPVVWKCIQLSRAGPKDPFKAGPKNPFKVFLPLNRHQFVVIKNSLLKW